MADGDFHLVTTSRKLVEWFLAAGAGKHDVRWPDPTSFAWRGTNMPLTRGDTVFVYLSPAFFQNLLSAQYQIELERRLRSAVEMELFSDRPVGRARRTKSRSPRSTTWWPAASCPRALDSGPTAANW